MKPTKLTQAFLASLKQGAFPSTAGDKITISRTVSAMALLYEKVRTAIEYREDHLLRRAAIERILKRRLLLSENGRRVSEYLLKELLWAKYIPEDSIPLYKIEVVQRSIDKYVFLRNEITNGRPNKEKAELNEWIVSSLAAEIEELIVPPTKRDAFINFIYQYFQPKVFVKDQSGHIKDIQVYIAVHRTFAKSDNDYIRYAILKLSFPNLQEASWREFQNKSAQFYKILKDTQVHLTHPLGSKLSKALKKEIVPFLVLRDLYEEKRQDFETSILDEKKLEEQIDSICRKRYEEIGKRIRRAAIRSIIYIFLTKMILALLLEYPATQYIEGKVNYIALGVNTLAPVLLMFIALLGISPPGQDNTRRIIQRIKEIIYEDYEDKYSMSIAVKTPKRRPVLTFIFSLFYLVTFFFVFGTIIAFLELIGFNVFSDAIFILFVSVVMFFAYRVRQTSKEYTMGGKESILSPVMNMVLLPILNVGKWLSREIARINFLIALFDFIIEAPFKVIFEVFEEWFSFMRRKKEEII